MHPTPLLRLGSALFLVLAAVNPASAQSRVYVGGTAIADIRRFDSIQYDPRVLASFFSGMSLDGTSAGGGARVGTFLHPLWSLELAVDAGSLSTNVFPNPVQSLPARSSTLRLPRTIVFSNSGRSVFLIRPEAGVRWSF